MKILQLSTYDRAGGAEKVALDLHMTYQKLGHETRMLVLKKRTTYKYIYEVNVYEKASPWAPFCAILEKRIKHLPKFRGQERIITWLRRTGLPKRWLDNWTGIENFNFPYSHNLLNDLNWRPDVIHAHNLHGEYFDLRALAQLSNQIPVVWTLHDAWALTGHCAHFSDINCNRWQIGCGNCPDLKRYPKIQFDNTHMNWIRKQNIYSNSNLAIATPSSWLKDLVDQSILRKHSSKIINNGIDISIFKRYHKNEARSRLGLPQNAFICMTAAQSVNKSNPFKDFQTIIDTAQELSKIKTKKKILFVCVGKSTETNNLPNFQYTGYISNPKRMAMYYQASDVLLHAAFIDNFPIVILESFSCGTPVIATDVGGIPEIVKDGETGFLIPRSNSKAMASQIVKLLNNSDLLRQMSRSAFIKAKQSFSLVKQAEVYLLWFKDLQVHYNEKSA